MTVAVCTTLAAFAMDSEDCWGAWLYGAEQLRANASVVDTAVDFFCAIETDARGLEPFGKLLSRLAELDGNYWTYVLDDGRTEVTTANRLRHLCMGQNLCSDYASGPGITHMLFMAADCQPDPWTIEKALAVKHPVVGGHVSTYGLEGPLATKTTSPFNPAEVAYPYEWNVQVHMPTAAYVMLERSVYKRLRWRWDIDEGMSDDPAYHFDCRTLLGIEAYVRHDMIGKHFPETIGAVETRHSDEQMKVHR